MIMHVSSWTLLRKVLVASGLVVAVTHAVGIATWMQSTNATLTRFDLSTIQSELDNPAGYLISLLGMLAGVTLVGYIAHAVRAHAPRPATLLLIAVALFLLNAIATYTVPSVWRIHAILARVSFVMLIASQIAFFTRYTMRKDWLIAWGTLIAAIVLFVLPKFFHIDIMMHVAGFDVNVILGLSEVGYLLLFYSGMYRMLSAAERETSE